MTYFTDGSIPRDTTGYPVGSVYVPGVGTVGVQGGAVATDSNGAPYAPMVIQQLAYASVNGTLQNAAGANGNGTPLALLGNSSVILTVNMSSFTGTVNFEVSEDGTNYDPLQVTQEGTNTIVTSVTGSTTTSIHLYEGSVAGLQNIRARVSGFSAGTVTVTAHAVPVTDAPRVLNTDLYGKNTTAGDTALIVAPTGALIVQQAKSNYPLAAGTGTTPVTIKNSAGYLKNFVVTTTATSALSFYDNASAASGTILYTTASNIAAGTIITLDMPFANGLTVSQASGSMAATIAYI
jgi:hypothetical protein